MKSKTALIFLLSIVLTACVKISEQAATPTTLPFVTSTLPPTKPPISLATGIPLTASPTSETPTIATSSPDCTDRAVLLEDVTYPDNTAAPRGEKFTKTWRFKNTGTCNWIGYHIVFTAGDPMESSDSVLVPQTEAGSTVDVSVDLVGPSADGIYTGFFELRKANGDPLAIGTGNTFWVKIVIGNVSIPTVAIAAFTPSNSTPAAQPNGPASCNYVSSLYYPNEIANLINSARTQNGLPALSINAQLTAAAQGHSIDMACFGFLGHNGSDGSTPYQRIVAAGYAPSYSEEIIYGGGYPQTAFDWWMNDQIHRDAILNPNMIEMGVGYAYDSDRRGGYFTVDFGSP